MLIFSESSFPQISFWDVLFSCIVFFLCSCVFDRLTNKGPMLWPVLGIIPSIPLRQDNVYDWSVRALKHAGGTFHFRGAWFGGAYGIVTVDPANVEYMLKTNFTNYPKGKYYRERFLDLLGDGIFNADDDLWKDQRRVATSEMHSPGFVRHSFHSMQELVHDKLTKVLERTAESCAVIDLQDILLRFTFDNICSAAFGVDTGCLSPDLPQVLFAKAFEESTEFSLFRFLTPPYIWKSMRVLGLGTEKRLKEAVRIVHDFANKTVSDRRSELQKLGSLKNRSDLLSRLMENQNYGFSDVYLRDFCISFILAGRDTSSVALVWFFWLINKHPQVEDRILSEITQVLSRRVEETKAPRVEVTFTAKELNEMVYLHAALTESLRLYPAVPIEMKEVREDDLMPDGTRLRKGARVFCSLHGMGRIEEVWGKDSEEFLPERWITKEGRFASESQFKYVVFNAGPRLCVGKRFAYTQMKMVAATVMARYRVRVAEGHVAVPKVTTTLYMKYGLPVTIQRR